jgi:hypothetical protein
MTTRGRKVDCAVPFGERAAGRVNLYVNAHEPAFQDASHWIKLSRGTLNEPLYLGIVGTPSAPLDRAEGFTVLGGWTARRARGRPAIPVHPVHLTVRRGAAGPGITKLRPRGSELRARAAAGRRR